VRQRSEECVPPSGQPAELSSESELSEQSGSVGAGDAPHEVCCICLSRVKFETKANCTHSFCGKLFTIVSVSEVYRLILDEQEQG